MTASETPKAMTLEEDKWTCTTCGAKFDQPTLHTHNPEVVARIAIDEAAELKAAVREWAEADAEFQTAMRYGGVYASDRYDDAMDTLRRLVGMEES